MVEAIKAIVADEEDPDEPQEGHEGKDRKAMVLTAPEASVRLLSKLRLKRIATRRKSVSAIG